MHRRRRRLLGSSGVAYRFNTTSGDAYAITVGDSQRMGRSAGTGGGYTDGARALSYTQRFANKLAALGYDVSTDAFFGSGMVASIAEYPLYYPDVTFGTGWDITGLGDTTSGGDIFKKSSASGAGAFTFTNSNKPCDTFDVYLKDDSTLSYTVTVLIDGVPQTSITPSSSPTANNLIKKVTFTVGTVGTHTLELDVTSGQAFLLGVVARDSTHYRTIIINCGARGWSSSDWVAASLPWRPMAMLDYLKPQLIDITLGGNDFRLGGAGLTETQFKTNMRALIRTGLAYGNVVLSYDTALAPSQEGAITQAQGRGFISDLATEFGLGIVDTIAIAGDYAAILAAGNQVDTNHTNGVPMQQVGEAYAVALSSLSLGSPKTLPIVFSDSFTMVDGSNVLNGRTADVGGVWSETTAVSHSSASNRVYGTGFGALAYTPTIAQADYSVEADFLLKSATPTVDYLVLRGVDNNNCYAAGYRTSAGGWVIAKYVSGVLTNLATLSIAANPPTTNALLKLRFQAFGDDLRFYVNDNLKLRVIDTTYTAAGKAGIFSFTTNTSTTGFHMDNFNVKLLGV